jgi:hypothetical protein
MAERGLGDVQTLGGAPEMQLLRHGHEVTQLSQLHDSFSRSIMSEEVLDTITDGA